MEHTPSDNIFVGDLPADITTDIVKNVFASYGTVSQARVMAPKRPGQKASALVRFGSVEEATWVVQNLNGNLAEGLEEPVVVRFANAPGANPSTGAQGKGGFQQPGGFVPQQQQQQQTGDNLFVGDLPAEITTEQVKQIFTAYGSVTQCRAIPPKGPTGKASALIRFANVDEASWVVTNLNGNLAEGLQEPIVVRFANAPGQAGAGGQAWGGAQQQPYGQGKGAFRNEPYNAATQGKAGGLKRHGVPDSFYNYYGAIRKAGLLGDARVSEESQVYVNNLPTDTSDHDLYKLFSPFGPIAANGAKTMRNPDGSCKGFGFVDFLDPAHAQAAIAVIREFVLPDGSSISPSMKVNKKNAV